MPRRALLVILALLLWAVRCGGPAPGSPAAALQRAEALWRSREPSAAYTAFQAIDPASPEGRAASARLRAADQRYREAIRLLRDGDPRAREVLRAGMALAPMDPRLYLPLARASRDQGLLVRAAVFYRKFLAARPDDPEAEAASRELLALDPDAELLGDAQVSQVSGARGERSFWPLWPLWPLRAALPRAALLVLGWGAPLLLVLGAGVVLWLRRRRAVSLAQVAAASPELHPALTYQLGGLRHELLKHRVAAVGPALGALLAGQGGAEEWTYLGDRLFGRAPEPRAAGSDGDRGAEAALTSDGGEEPLLRAWEAHLRGLHRALGLRDELLRGDRLLREAHRAVQRIARLERPLRRAGAQAARGGALTPGVLRGLRRVHEAREALLAFDLQAARLCESLSRTEISDALLREVTASVRAEYAAGRVPLEELALVPVPAGIFVEVYRADLLLVLRNLTRNAVRAAALAPPPRRVALDVQIELQATGEEMVRLRVRDSSPEPCDVADVADRRPERGLGLVVAALNLYRGGVDVEPGSDGYAKAVTVWLFRAMDRGEERRSQE